MGTCVICDQADIQHGLIVTGKLVCLPCARRIAKALGADRRTPLPEPRDPRAPSGMSDIEYRAWKYRRDIADDFIGRMDAGRER